jgi:phage FluMu protein Com
METGSPAGPGHFEKSCSFCGARLRVLARAGSRAQLEDYHCPQCDKRYQVEASQPPEVQLLAPRTDGRNDRYQETMF